MRPLARLPAAALLTTIVASGCAQGVPWKNATLPWQTSDTTTPETEKYGATADQRIDTLAKRAREAKQAGGTALASFTEDLARSILTEHDPRVRCEILRVAAEFDSPAALAICRGALDDPADQVRLVACDAWGRRGGPEAVKLLAHRFETDTEIDVRLRAVKRLGEVKDKAAIPVLAKALEDPDPAIQYRAVAALKQVSGRDLGDDVNTWRAWAADPGAEPEWSIAETFRKLF